MACPDPIMTTMFSSSLLLTLHRCTFSGYLPQKHMPSKDIQDCLRWAPLPSHVSAAQNTLGSWSSFTQENKKKQCPTTTKRKLPRKVKFLHHLCHYVVIVVFNEMDCQIISSPEVPPYTRYGLKLPPPQKKTIKPVIGSLASLFCQKSSQHLGSHEYTLNGTYSSHIRVTCDPQNNTQTLKHGAKYFWPNDDWWLLLIAFLG